MRIGDKVRINHTVYPRGLHWSNTRKVGLIIDKIDQFLVRFDSKNQGWFFTEELKPAKNKQCTL